LSALKQLPKIVYEVYPRVAVGMPGRTLLAAFQHLKELAAYNLRDVLG